MNTKQRALIIGAGAVGIAIGACLASQGWEITYLARENTARAIQKGGIERIGLFGGIEVAASALTVYTEHEHTDYKCLPDEAVYDYVLVCAKTNANPEIAAKLSAHRQCMKADAKLVLVQNGWGNEVPYLNAGGFTKETIYHARVITGFERTAPNVSRVTVHTAPVLFGSLFYPERTAPVKPLAEAINAAGIPSETSEAMEAALWAKMLYNTTLNPLGAILGVCYGQLTEWQESREIMDALIQETFSVMRAAGYRTFWDNAEDYQRVFYDKLVPDTYHHRSSTLQDIEKRQYTEIGTLNGCVLALAVQYGVDVPNHEMIVRLIRCMENNFSNFKN